MFVMKNCWSHKKDVSDSSIKKDKSSENIMHDDLVLVGYCTCNKPDYGLL